MILLGIESATELVGVAVGDDRGVRAAVWSSGRRRHGEALAPAIVHALDQAEVSLGDVGAVAVDLGPGLFTGLRVGVATAKGLAQALGVGIVGLTSVEVLARAALEAGWGGPVVAVVDARRGEVFAARFGPRSSPGAPDGGDGWRDIEETSAPARWTPDGLAAALSETAGRPQLAVGDGALRYAGVLGGIDGLAIAGPSLSAPPPAALVDLAAERLRGGAATEPPELVRPRYLRDADARINWVQRRSGVTEG